MSKPVLRVGVLGQGRSGFDIHVNWLRRVPEQFKVEAIADQLPERRAQASTELGARTYKDYRELLAAEAGKLDLIVNALPSFLHPKGTIEALGQGFHVVCEKPPARTVKDFDAMVAAAKAAKRLYLPFQNSRFYPFFAKMREVFATGKLGKIIYIRSNWSGYGRRWDWQTRQEYWGGNLLNTGPHPVDQAVVLFGNRMPQVFSRQACVNPYGDADNFSLVVLYGKGAPTIELCVSSFQAYPQGDQYNVSAEFGGLTGGASGLKWRYFDPAKAPFHQFCGEWSDNRRYCGEKLDWIEEEWKPEGGPSNFEVLSRGFYDNAYDIIVNGAPRIIKLDEVRRQVAIMEECGRQNRLPKLKERFLTRPAPGAD